MNCVESRFLALEPDDAFAAEVLAFKERVRRLVGEQLYLDHPPHLTLAMSVFRVEADVAGPIRELCRGLAAPAVTIRGWHVFEADQLTGSHTLVCDVAPDAKEPLARVQQEAIAAAAPRRDRVATRECYDESWDRLSDEERANVEQFGFPFVGPIWHPHVTVASVRPEDWDAVWLDLAGTPPEAIVRFSHLSIYGIRGDEPILIERFALEGVG
ncbi:MAG TPA: 2'-5' RNA ligase family protein [Thermoguttaceae bacterium]|nr:2'-5' RNA ligase family protein [Thermoguttaceae bacterium]